MDAQGTKGRSLEPTSEQVIDHILVALDPSGHSRAALEAAAEMARLFDAELTALFIEDVNVRRLAELPFVQEIGFYTGACRRVQSHELSRQLRVQVGRVRRHFRVVTRHVESRCSFREVRGRVSSTVLEAASEADVAIVGKGAWSAVDTGQLAPDVRRVLKEAPASTLVLQAETTVRPPVRVVYPDTPLGRKALAIAARLAEDGDLVVFLLADDPGKAARLREDAQTWAEGREIELAFQTLTEASVSRLAHLMAHEGAGTLVLPADAHAMEDEALMGFLDETTAPVLLVR